jgi:ATP-binding cassette subfamily B protein
MTTVQGLLPLLNAYLVGQALGSIAFHLVHRGQPLAGLIWLLIFMGLVEFVTGQTSYLSFYLDDIFGMRVNLYMERELFTKVHSLDQSYYEDQTFNNQLNKVSENISSMRSLNRNFLMAGNSVVQLASTAVVLVAFEPLIALAITLALMPVLIVEVKTSNLMWRTWDRRGNDWRLAAYLRRLLTNVIELREIKLYGLRDFLVDRWQQHYLAGRGAQLGIERRAQLWRAGTGILDIFVSTGSQVWLLLRVLERGLGLSSFVFYRQVIENYANAGSGLVRNLHTMQENSLYVNDYFELLALKPRIAIAIDAKAVPERRMPPRIEFERVSFSYPGSDRPVVRQLSLVIEPGEDVAIVGANGAGKTTIIKLLLRLYDPSEGRILIDDQDLKSIDLMSWYKLIGALFQDFNKYSSLTVRDNISMGRANPVVSDQLVEQAARESGANTYIQDYPAGYDQILNRSFENGIEPSGGQWQRIALARAFYRSASILILDEPTSSIDAKGEFEIFNKIAATQKHKTTIIISHRFSTVRNAQKIVVLEKGSIRESGTHDELIALGGKYKELFEIQAAGYR